MTDKEALKRLIAFCFINFDNEIQWGIGVSIDKADPELASHLAQYLSDEQKEEYKGGII